MEWWIAAVTAVLGLLIAYALLSFLLTEAIPSISVAVEEGRKFLSTAA